MSYDPIHDEGEITTIQRSPGERGREYGTAAVRDSTIVEVSHRIDFAWKNIVYCTRENPDAPEKTILNGISGVTRAGKMCALMGSSGAGKTTLLDALAGRVVGVQGEVLVNDVPITPVIRRKFTAYVVQQEKLSDSFTVRETLLFHAIMKMPKTSTSLDHDRVVDNLLEKLRLQKTRDTPIGGPYFRGISGGEKRRVSIGVELVTSPSVVFLDEPTSGLDSNSSFMVIRVLKELADSGRTIICSIHQPRPDIFFMMDHVMLISEGEIFFYGTPNACDEYFSSIGYPCPEHINLADFMLDVVTPDVMIPGTEQKSLVIEDIRLHRANFSKTSFGQTMSDEISQKSKHSSVFGLSDNAEDDRISVIKQFRTLCWRSFVAMDRNPLEVKARIGAAIFQGLLGGIAFFDQSEEAVGARGRLGALFFLSMGSTFEVMTEVIQVFPLERDLVMHERKGNTYSINAYFLSKMVMDRLPLLIIPFLFGGILYSMVGLREGSEHFFKFWSILFIHYNAAQSLGLLIGSLVPSVALGNVYGPLVPIVFVLFSGFFAYIDDIPSSVRFMTELSLVRWTFQGVAINEFDDKVLEGTAEPCEYQNGDDVLEEYEYDDQSFGYSVAMVFVLFVSFSLLLYISLVFRDRRSVHYG